MAKVEIQKWADKAMYEAEEMPKDERGNVTPQVHLISATTDPLGAIAAASAIYSGKVIRSLEEVTDEMRRDAWEQTKKTHLKAPLEYVDFHFMIEGVTRAFTHQMVRQRTAVYSQESLRFAVKENISEEVALPPSIKDVPQGDGVWQNAIDAIDTCYRYLVENGMPAEDARGLLPHSITTRLHYKTNLRNLLEHAGNRLCTQAQFEWRLVFAQLVDAIRNYDPVYPPTRHSFEMGWQFRLIADDNVFRPVCYEKGYCPFMATFDRDCTIRERVNRGEFDSIDDAEWLLDPAAARRG